MFLKGAKSTSDLAPYTHFFLPRLEGMGSTSDAIPFPVLKRRRASASNHCRKRRGPRPPFEDGKPVLTNATWSKTMAAGIPEGPSGSNGVEGVPSGRRGSEGRMPSFRKRVLIL